MKVFIILATIALAYGAKLERTYLPPSHAGTSGGSGNFLQTPISSNYQNGRFAQAGLQTEADFSGNGFSQTASSFSQGGASFSENGVGLSEENQFSQSLKSTGFNNFAESRPERAQAALERNAAILRQDSTNDGETFAYAFETENGIYAEENGVATNGVEAQGGYSYTGDDGQVYSIRYTADQNGFVPQGDHIPTAPPVPEEILKALEQNARDEAAGIFDDGSYKEAKYSSNNINQQNYQQNYNGNDDDTVVTNSALLRNYPTDADTPRSTGGSGAVEKAYLPPFATAEVPARSSVRGSSSGLAKAYIPPFASQSSRRPASFARTSSSPVRGPNGSFSARGSSSNGVEKAYLPPFSQSDNGFGRRQQTFDSKNGYQY